MSVRREPSFHYNVNDLRQDGYLMSKVVGSNSACFCFHHQNNLLTISES